MDWFQFISSLVGSLAWPLAAIAIGLMFKEQVRKLLAKMKSFKGPGGFEASFSEEVAKVAADAAHELPANAPPVVPQEMLDPAKRLDYRPSAMIQKATFDLDKALSSLVRKLKLDVPYPANMRSSLLALGPVLPVRLRKTIDDLTRLRDVVVHSREFEPDEATAKEFVLTAYKVIGTLQAIEEKS